MKRQRNTQEVREQDKCPPNQTKEEEIGNLIKGFLIGNPDKKFRMMIVKMIRNLENKLELQINGKTVETVADFIFLGSKSLQMVIAAMKLKDAHSLEGKL